jgi:hypothetical protein
MSATVDSTGITCNSASDGTITISAATGGHGSYEYSIDSLVTWQRSGSFTGLAPDTYYISMRDSAYHGCVINLRNLTFVDPQPIPLSGIIKYYKVPSVIDTLTPFPMGNIIVALISGTDTIAKDTTIASGPDKGKYSFDHVCPGTYTLSASSALVPSANPINFTDVANIQRWIVLQRDTVNIIPMVQYLAGDVRRIGDWNLVGTVDANFLAGHFLNNYVFSWDNRPTWTFWTKLATDTISYWRLPAAPIIINPTIAVTPLPNPGQTIDLFGLFTGDFDHSWKGQTTKSFAPTVRLDPAQTRIVEPGVEFELPILAGSSMEVGALSLLINFPSDKLEIVGAHLSNDIDNPVLFKLLGDELRMGWTSLTPISLNAGDKMITLRLKLISALAKDEFIQLSLTGSHLNELADGDIKVLTDALLLVDKIGSKAIGVGELNAGQLAFANYPNPFNETTTFVFSLPYEGLATIEVYDMLGKKVNVVLKETMVAGEHRLSFNSNDLKSGVYSASLTLKADGQMLMRTIKIIRNK